VDAHPRLTDTLGMERAATEMYELVSRIVRDVVKEELASAAGLMQEYSSVALPQGISRRYFADVCRQLGIGQRDGKVWRVARADWERARGLHPQAEASALPDPADQLRAAGLRLTQ
jgi:hypothetical protein